MIPALPFDMGRIVRAWPGSAAVAPSRDSLVAPYLARGFALLIAIVGVVRLLGGRLDGTTLIGLAILIEYLVRSEARLLEDGGYFDDGVFGYDFSEGYTSLESGAPKVRPYRESALKRWRRRRSDLRRQRRVAREAAEERRMDEILEKLHREGRSALTDEENRFLVRVSARYRNRTKNT
jgi:stage IV sporulation protein FB